MKHIGKIFIVCIMVLAMVVGYITTNVLSDEEPAYDLSDMKKNLKVITEEPHSTLLHYENLREVREYIVEQLNSYGVETSIYTYKDVPTHKEISVELNNLYGKIDGKYGERGSYIMLVCHYDSASGNPQNDDGYSYGAADDGYGVATILETIKIMSAKRDTMVNGIKFLITDGEELRLLGSKAAVEQNPEIFEGVSYVINLEARGTAGPALMFELFGNEERVLELYQKGNSQLATSIVTDLYGGSDRSDFYNLSTLELPGINLTAIDQVENYHTPMDCYGNVSDETMRHFITQILPITEAFTTEEKYGDIAYFRGNEGSNFFNIVPGTVVSFSSVWGVVLTIMLTLATACILIKEKAFLFEALRVLGNRMVLLVGVAVIFFTLSFLSALITGATFKLAHMGKVPGDDVLVIAIPAVLFLVLLFSRHGKKYNTKTVQLADIILQNALLLLLTILYPGAAYCVLIPYMVELLVYLLDKLFSRKNNQYRGHMLLMLFPGAILILLFAPLLFILQQAFSIAALAMNCVIMVYISGSCSLCCTD